MKRDWGSILGVRDRGPAGSLPGTPELVEGERRYVAILFLDLKGFTAMSEGMDHESLHGVIGGVMEVLAELVGELGGYVDKIEGDRIMALFGAKMASENDCERAVACALRMMEAIGEANEYLSGRGTGIGARAGIACGEVTVAPDAVGHLTAMGNAVNLASRMEEMSGVGSVTVTGAVYRACRESFGWEELGPAEVRGWSRPVSTYSPRSFRRRTVPRWERTSKLPRASFVDREEALGKLKEVWECWLGQAPERNRLGGAVHRIVRILGEAGAGKSRLAHRFLGNVARTVLRGHALAFDQPPHQLWASLVRQHLGIGSGSPEAAGLLESGVSELAGLAPEETGRELLRSLPYLRSLLSIKTDLPTDGEERRSETLAAIRNFVRSIASSGRTVLLLEDLHFADDASMEALGFLLSNCITEEPLMFICCERPGESDGGWLEQVPDGYCTVADVRVGPLAEDHCRDMAGQMLGTAVEAGALDLLLGRAEGNPLFFEELVLGSVENGSLALEDGAWRFGGDSGEPFVPGSLAGIVLSRLDAMPERDRKLLQCCSVIGTELGGRTLKGLLERLPQGWDVGREMGNLIERGHLEETAEGYRFHSVIARDAAYGSILRRNRRTLHAAAGETLVDVLGDEAEGSANVVATHWELAEDRVKRVEWGLRAARSLNSSYQNEDALSWTRKLAVWLDDDDPRLAEALLVRARLLDRLGRRSEEEEVLGRLLELAPEEPSHLLADVRYLAGSLLEHTGKPEESRGHYEACLGISAELGDIALETKALMALGGLAREHGDWKTAREHLERALRVSDCLSGPALKAKVEMHMGIMDAYEGEAELAAERMGRALELAGEADDRTLRCVVLGNSAMVLWNAGRYAEAEGAVGEALALAREMGDRNKEQTSLDNLGILAESRGDSDGAIELYREALEIARELDDPKSEANVLLNLASAYSFVGRREEGVPLLREAIGIFEGLGDRQGLASALFNLGGQLGDAEDFENALETLERSRGIFESLGDGESELHCRAVIAETLLDSGGTERASGMLKECIEDCSETGIEWLAACCRALEGCMMLSSGDTDGAMGVMDECCRLVDERDIKRFQADEIARLHAELSGELGSDAVPWPSSWEREE